MGALILALALLSLPACGRRNVEASAPGATAPGVGGTSGKAAVAAVVDGHPISLAEVDERVAPQLAQVEQQIYDARQEGLKDMIGEMLIEKEAKARGIAVEALLAAEVDAKIDSPTPDQLARIYDANRARFVGVSQEQAMAQIQTTLKTQAQVLRQRAFRQELLQKASVQTSLTPPRVKVEIPKGAPILGPADAQITIVSFLDYQCPYCHRSQAAIEELLHEYPGKVRLVHFDFPLDIHNRAMDAARAAHCAGDQGKFWDYHRNLLSAQGNFDKDDLEARAATLGMDRVAFGKCLASTQHDPEIRAGLERGRKLGVSSTPTFFVNGRRLVGARPYEDFEEIVLNEGI
jgi:protein-disulfide isomerase